MALLPIIEAPDPRLKTISEPVETVDDDLRTLIADMFETMYDAPGIGLAAIQVGVPKRVLVIDLQEPVEHDHAHGEHCDHEHEVVKDPRVFINPEILESSGDLRTYEEGCLSVPDFSAEVRRHAKVLIKGLDREGKPREITGEGLLAVVLQHEIDHLNGILFIDHISRLKRGIFLRRLKKQAAAR